MKLGVMLLPLGLYVVKKCYLMLPGPLFFLPALSVIQQYKQTGRRLVSLCLQSKWQRREAALVKIAATQDCGLDTMNPDGEGSC